MLVEVYEEVSIGKGTQRVKEMPAHGIVSTGEQNDIFHLEICTLIRRNQECFSLRRVFFLLNEMIELTIVQLSIEAFTRQ